MAETSDAERSTKAESSAAESSAAESSAAESSAAESSAVESHSKELFLEVRSQEISHRLLAPLLRRLVGRLFEELMSRGITLGEIVTAATPRRLALCIRGLPEKEPDGEKTLLGPAVEQAYDDQGEPSDELLRFCEENDLSPDDLEEVPTERGRYLASVRSEPGGEIAAVLSELVERHLRELIQPGDAPFGAAGWPRPVTGLSVLLDGEPLDLTFEGRPSQAATVGHPTESREPIEIEDWTSWSEALRSQGMVPSLDERATVLSEQLDRLCESLGGTKVEVPGLIERLAASCAIPTLIQGRFDPELLTLPEPLLVQTLAQRQAAFAVRQGDELLPFFFTVIDRRDDPEGQICRGYERAVAGHLSDARFFYDSDRQVPLAQRVRRLEQLTFHKTLGTWAEKSRRLRSLVEPACKELGWDEHLEQALEAAALLKADLATASVMELPQLKGTLGGLYAREEGYVEAVWQAIQDQYQPISSDDPIPRSPVGQVLAVADRLGSLVGFFGLDAERPTRRRDPYGLRPMALGLLRILIEAEMPLDLDLLSARAVRLYDDRLSHSAEELLQELQKFLQDRLLHLLGLWGYDNDEIEAVLAVGTRDLPDLHARLKALKAVREDEGFGDLVSAAKRISKMVAQAPETELQPELLVEEAEQRLHEQVLEVSEQLQIAVKERRYEDALRRLLPLAPTLDQFFADVLVMDEDERRRANRLALLQNCRRLYWRVARLNAMEEDRWVESDS